MMTNDLSTRELVGGGYDAFWKSKKRYVVCKGSRASKKSTTAALKIIVRMMQCSTRSPIRSSSARRERA
ncbi:hypothetical protein [uncultured Selenomonas sp.]|uniref:hypothetical protein n=1 Tax=uncultured Selenomonas sp. TaxID=159275 RepID=UPI0025D6F69F|nr:hypothetical protein [uncultured Selenomonas sp.]